MDIRVGLGYDVHALAEGLPLWLGGVRIEHTKGCVAHSDGDVALHAVCDALLGAVAAGDIGKLFPDTDPRYKGADSRMLLRAVREKLDAAGVRSVRADVRGAVAECIQQILRRQRRRILMLVGGRTCACAEMVGGYEDAYAAAGMTVDPELVIAVENTPEQVNTCLKKLLISRVTFDAVLCTDATLALSAQKALQRTGLNLPIIGLTDSLAARCSSPALTCADCAIDALCDAVCTALDALLSGAPAENVLIPTHLNERDTFRNA